MRNIFNRIRSTQMGRVMLAGALIIGPVLAAAEYGRAYPPNFEYQGPDDTGVIRITADAMLTNNDPRTRIYAQAPELVHKFGDSAIGEKILLTNVYERTPIGASTETLALLRTSRSDIEACGNFEYAYVDEGSTFEGGGPPVLRIKGTARLCKSGTHQFTATETLHTPRPQRPSMH